VLVDSPFVEGIDLRRLGHSACGGDLLGHLVERCKRATGQEDLRPFAGEGPGHRTADRAARSVDHSVLVLEKHVPPPSGRPANGCTEGHPVAELDVGEAGEPTHRGQWRAGISCTAQPLPSGSLKKTNEPQSNFWTSLTSTPRSTSSSRAACMSG